MTIEIHWKRSSWAGENPRDFLWRQALSQILKGQLLLFFASYKKKSLCQMEVNGRRGCDNRRKKISLKSLLIPGSSSSGLNVFFQPVLFESILCAKCCITQWEYGAWDSRTAVAKLLLKLLELSSALGSGIQALFWAWAQFLPVDEWFSAWLLVKSYPGSLKNTDAWVLPSEILISLGSGGAWASVYFKSIPDDSNT